MPCYVQSIMHVDKSNTKGQVLWAGYDQINNLDHPASKHAHNPEENGVQKEISCKEEKKKKKTLLFNPIPKPPLSFFST